MIGNYKKKQKINKKAIYSVIAFIGIILIINFSGKSINVASDKAVSDKVKNNILKGKTIVIDAGHGGSDVGAERQGVKEKDINISIALKLEKILKKQGAEVIMTRVDDEEVSLEERTHVSNNNKADLFVSIHQNAVEDNVTYGIETWFEQTKSESGKLAELVQQSIIELTHGNDRGLKFEDSLYVTKNTEAPSILVECGFISSNDERKLLKDNKYQNSIANGIANGINQYFHK